jgi:transcriptional regulator with AAA-type ATPase domain
MSLESEQLELDVSSAGRWVPVRSVALPLARELVVGRALFGGDPSVGGRHVLIGPAGEDLSLRAASRRSTTILEGERLRPLAAGSSTLLTRAALRAGVTIGLGPRFLRLAAGRRFGVGTASVADVAITSAELSLATLEPLPAPMGLAHAVVALVTTPVAQLEGVARQVCEHALSARLETMAKAPPRSWWTFSAPCGEGVVVISRDPAGPPLGEEERRVCEQVVGALERAGVSAPVEEDDADPRRVQRWFDDYLGGASPAVVAFHEDLSRIAADMGRRLGDGGTPPILLLSGEPGVGKDRAAGALHTVLRRLQGRAGPFVSVNLAAVPDALAEAELFGVATSAATGVKERPGAFERARGGTIFLNEVDKCPRPLQAKLLTVLEARKVTRIGGQEERDLDAVVVAANNGRMPDLVREGVVIQPLADRLGVPLEVPSLRERGRDLELYATAFLADLGVEAPAAVGRIVRVLADLPWPGNIRQLRNVIERVCQLERTDPEGIARIHGLTMPSQAARATSDADPRYRAMFERWQALDRKDAALAAEQEVDERTVRNWKKKWRELGLLEESR